MSQGNNGRVFVCLRTIFLTSFIIFSDDILSWYIGLSQVVIWTVVGIFFISGYTFVRVIRRWPNWFQQRRDHLSAGLEEVQFALFAFVFAGVSKAWYRTDLGMVPFLFSGGVWLLLGLQFFSLDLIVSLQFRQADLSGRAFKLFRQAVKWWIRKAAKLLPMVVVRTLRKAGSFLIKG